MGAVALGYITIARMISPAPLPQGPAQSFVQPLPVPKPKEPDIPKQVVLGDPRVGVPYPNPATYHQPVPAGFEQAGQGGQAATDPLQAIRASHLQMEHESAFASMMTPEEKAPVKTQSPLGANATQEGANQEPSFAATPVYIIPQGAIAPLALDSRIEGEMSGPVDAHFTEDFYLPGTRTLVIPQGSKVLGQATQVGNTQQRRIAIAFTKIQRDPVNRSCDISLSEPALDEAGSAGVTGKVDTHLASTIFGSALAAVLQGAAVGVVYGGGYGPGQLMIGNMANGGAQVAGQLLNKWTNKLPRITVSEGNRLSLPFTKDTPVGLCGGKQ
jgi:type IV secretory pathway VirB10-like protein